MANFTFSEILTIVIVILIVFGPNRLPELARKTGALLAKARVAVAAMRDEFTTEYREVVEPMQEVRDEIKAAGRDLRQDVTKIGDDVKAADDEIKAVGRDLRQDVTKIGDDVKAAGDEAVAAAKSLEESTPAGGPGTAADAAENDGVATSDAGNDVGDDGTPGVTTLPGGDRPRIDADDTDPEATADPAAEESA